MLPSEIDPNDPFSWYLLGRAYMTTSNFGKAYEAYQQAVYRDGKNPAFWCSIGVLYYNINQFHDALDAYSRAIRIHPYLAEVWFNLGALYEACNDQMTDAIDAYQRTLQLDPANQIVGQRLREIREHQSSNAQLSPPPPPKDISPSSSSWHYATNTGGAPAALAQSGLAPEASPTIVANGNGGSPPMNPAHRFEAPPPNTAGSRPRSTDPYRRLSGGQDSRRVSGSMHAHPPPPPGAIDQSPRTHSAAGPSSNRLPPPSAGSSVLPQIKNIHDRPAQMVGPHSRANSPPSPRTRGMPESIPPPQAHHDPRYSSSAQGPYPFPAHLSHGQSQQPPNGSPSSHRSANDPHAVYEMDWDRSHRGPPQPHPNAMRNGSSHGRMAPPTRSPPGSSHSSHGPPFAQQTPHPHHLPHGYERSNGGGGPLHPGTSSAARGHFFESHPGGPPPPPPAGYGYPPNSAAAAVAYQREREREEELARRRSSGSTTSGGKPTNGNSGPPLPPSSLQESSRPVPAQVESPQPAPPPAPTGRGRGGRGKKDDGEKKEPAARGGRKAKAKDGVETTPKRKTKAAKEKEEKAAEKAAAVLNGVANSSRPLPPPPPPAPAPAPTPPPQIHRDTPPTSRATPQAPNAPKREVDEDYDEGVDALMGLAASGHTPTQPSAQPLPPTPRQQPPPPPPPAPAPSTNSLAPPPPSSNHSGSTSPAPPAIPFKQTSPNPRKRSLPSPNDKSSISTNEPAIDGPPEAKKSKSEIPSPPQPLPPAPAPASVEEAEEGEISEPVSSATKEKEPAIVESNGSKVEGMDKEKDAVAAAA